MNNPLAIARTTLLDPPGISDTQLQQLMDQLVNSQVDAADAYFQHSRLESWVLDDGIIKEGNHTIEQGAGLRAISGEKTGFAYTEDLALGNLLQAARSARAITNAGQSGSIRVQGNAQPISLYTPTNPL